MKSSFARYRSVGHKLVTGFMEPEVLLVAGALDEAQRARSVGGAVAEIGVHHGKLFIGLGILLGVTAATARHVCTRHTWKHID